MAKLLKQQLKENFRDISLWIFIPPIIFIGLNALSSIISTDFLQILLVLTTIVLYTSFAVAMFIVITNDYNRFYGEKAAFFDVLPIKTSSITSSRLINFIVATFVIGVVAIIEFIIFFMAANIDGASFTDLFNEIKFILGQYKTSLILSFILVVISSAISNIAQIMFSITVGSDRIFKRLNKLGPVVVYILVTLVLGILGMGFGLDFIVGSANNQAINQSLDLLTSIFWKGCLVNIIVSAILIIGTNLFHEKRLTVA